MPVPKTMTAMVMVQPGEPLDEREVPVPRPGPGQVLLCVDACGVCRTDLHIFDGELNAPKLPLILGHEIAARVVGVGKECKRFKVGDRVGVPWLGRTCGSCRYCRGGRENLCDDPGFTGYTIDGGYAHYTVANEQYCFALPQKYDAVSAAPLLCAGLIGFRSLRMLAADTKDIGIYGFGAAAHIITQIAAFQGRRIFAFTKPGDKKTQAFAVKTGAAWVGGSDELPPSPLDAAIIFAPAGNLVPAALRAVSKGGVVVCGGIHMSDVPSFPYGILWGERSVRSVANLTRADGEEFFSIVSKVPVKTSVTALPLREANRALEMLRKGSVEGAIVLKNQGT
ncbi:MAG TPA: zinc-dependent alcohol dehydrogenase family protein [Chitinivibrionales bacterium]|nr:zinc-dependent alcohol dehydrogenase family protein [Chitinivibrionales bacterium]